MLNQIQLFCVPLLWISLISSLLSAEKIQNSTWNQWRGPQRTSQISSFNWPNDLSEKNLSESWSVKLGPSYSGPVLSEDKVFVTETKAKKYEVVRAFSRKTGKLLWETEWEGSMRVPFFAAVNGSWIRSTPAYENNKLYVAGIRDLLVCLNTITGNVEWKLDFVTATGSSVPSFGCVSSPLIMGNHLFVQAGGGFAKVNKQTGEMVWHTLKDGGGMYGSAFSSPIAGKIRGVMQLIVQSRKRLAGIDIENGQVLWSQDIPAFRGMNILTPTIIGNSVFTSSYGGRSTLLNISRNKNAWEVTQAWTQKSQGYMSSPVVIDGHIYLHLRNQRLVCLEASSGIEKWRTTPFGKYWSMVANGNLLLALDQKGELLFIEASPDQFKLLDRRRVADNSWAHLAIEGHEIYIRDLEAIKKFSWKQEVQ